MHIISIPDNTGIHTCTCTCCTCVNIIMIDLEISKAKSEEAQNFHDKEATFADFYNADLHEREKVILV